MTFAPAEDLAAVYAAIEIFMPADVISVEAPRTTVAIERLNDRAPVLCNVLGVTGGVLTPELAAWQTALAERVPDPASPSPARYYDSVYLAAIAVSAAERLGSPPTGENLARVLARLSAGPDAAIGPENIAQIVEILAGGLESSVDVRGISGGLDFNAAGDIDGPVESWRYHLTDHAIEPVGVLYDPATGYARPHGRSPDARCAGLLVE